MLRRALQFSFRTLPAALQPASGACPAAAQMGRCQVIVALQACRGLATAQTSAPHDAQLLKAVRSHAPGVLFRDQELVWSVIAAGADSRGALLGYAQMQNKLLYRAKQRGFLELDLLVGMWAEREIPRMSLEMLGHMSTVLDQVGGLGVWGCPHQQCAAWGEGLLTALLRDACYWALQENPDLFKWLTGRLEPPQALAENPAFAVRCAQGASRVASRRAPAAQITLLSAVVHCCSAGARPALG